MVERSHHQLKAVLMSHPDCEHWVDNLPIVLLGIRSPFKPDVNACAAELVYGSTLGLPGRTRNQIDHMLMRSRWASSTVGLTMGLKQAMNMARIMQ